MPDHDTVDIANHPHFRAGLARIWEQSRPQHVAAAESLVDALGSWPHTDLAEVVQTAHRLAGTLGMYDLGEGSRLASELEQGALGGVTDHAAAGELCGLAESLRDRVVRHRIDVS